ncbi:MAG TPA: hypothetical protein PLI09_16170 [Candidatus Hydrogenedentes bacterium]|nr:hypothetical protein [Candidatus Hydrogenedentota bacterium]
MVEEVGVVGVVEALWEEFGGEGEGASVEIGRVVGMGVVLFVPEGGLGVNVLHP